MPHTTSFLRRGTSAALLLLWAVQVSGCSQWRTLEQVTPEAIAKDEPSRYELVLHDSTTIRVKVIQLRNDSLRLFNRVEDVATGVPPDRTLAVDDVASIRARVGDPTTTAILVVGAIAIIAAGISSLSGDWWGDGSGGGGGGGGGSGNGGGDGFIGSCPLVYSWDGSSYRLDSGTFGGAITPSLARTDLDNLDFIRPAQGVLRFRMTDEAAETEYVDAIEVLAVDHDVGTVVVPDGRANGRLLSVERSAPPRVARADDGRDLTALVRAADGREWHTALVTRDPATPAGQRDGLVLTFARPSGDSAVLVVDARNSNWSAGLLASLVAAHGRLTTTWYDAASSNEASAPLRAMQAREGTLAVSVWDGSAWRAAGSLWEAGPEVTKRQAIPLRLDDLPPGDLQVRLEALPAFWQVDQVALASPGVGTVSVTPLVLRRARDNTGADRRADLRMIDQRHLVMEPGDTVHLEFRDLVAAPSTGQVRSYLVRSNGWYRIHGGEGAAPDLALLARLAQPEGVARLVVERFNEAVRRLEAGVRDGR